MTIKQFVSLFLTSLVTVKISQTIRDFWVFFTIHQIKVLFLHYLLGKTKQTINQVKLNASYLNEFIHIFTVSFPMAALHSASILDQLLNISDCMIKLQNKIFLLY